MTRVIQVERAKGLTKAGAMKTKDFLARAGISESTLRRWLRDGNPVPELARVQQDWRGQRDWTDADVQLVLAYKERKVKDTDRSKRSRGGVARG